MSREIDVPQDLDDVRYLAERGKLPEYLQDQLSQEDLGALVRGEEVNVELDFTPPTPEVEEAEEVFDYEAMTNDDLRALLVQRVDSEGNTLSVEGKKAELVERLRASDANEL